MNWENWEKANMKDVFERVGLKSGVHLAVMKKENKYIFGLQRTREENGQQIIIFTKRKHFTGTGEQAFEFGEKLAKKY